MPRSSRCGCPGRQTRDPPRDRIVRLAAAAWGQEQGSIAAREHARGLPDQPQGWREVASRGFRPAHGRQPAGSAHGRSPMTRAREVVVARAGGMAARILIVAAEGASVGLEASRVVARRLAWNGVVAASTVALYPGRVAGPRRRADCFGSVGSVQDHRRCLPRHTSGRPGPLNYPRSWKRPAVNERQRDMNERANAIILCR